MQLTLVDALLPIDVEEALGNDRHLVDFVGIEGDNAQTDEVSDVVDALVFSTLQLQLTRQRLLGLHPMLNGSNVDPLFAQGLT